MLRQTSVLVLLTLLPGGCADPTPVLWTDDGGSRDAGSRDAGSRDAGSRDADAHTDAGPSDGGTDTDAGPTEECPCAAYCYAMRADVAHDLFAPRAGELWQSLDTDPARSIERTIDGVTDQLAWPRVGGSVRLIGDDEAWVVWNGDSGDDAMHALYRWTGSGWEEHPLPPLEPSVSRRLAAAQAGERLIAIHGPDAFVWDGSTWNTEHPWDEGWSPIRVAASGEVLAVQVESVHLGATTFETWARWSDEGWTRLATEGATRLGLAVAGDLVIIPGRVFDAGGWYPLTGDGSTGGDRPVRAGRAGGVRWVVTPGEALDLTDPSAPVRHALPFALRSAAFPPDGPLWVGGAGTAYWNGASFTVTRAWSDEPLPTQPVAAYGSPTDFHVVMYPVSRVFSVRRFRRGVSERRSLPEVPWGEPTELWLWLTSLADVDGELFFGMRGGIGRGDGATWTTLHRNAEIDPTLGDAQSAYLTAGGAGVFAGIGARIYRWDGDTFAHEADLPGNVWNMAADEAGGVWATDAETVYERRATGWAALDARPATPARAVLAKSAYASDGRVVLLGFAPGNGAAVYEWDGAAWSVTPLPGADNTSRLSGRGSDIVVTTRTLRQWRRRGLAEWELDTSCEYAGAMGETWWPEGEPLPWLLTQSQILRPRAAP